MNGKDHDPSLENPMPSSYPELGARVHGLEVRMTTVEKDIAVIRATCATKDDIAMLLERMNQQHVAMLEKISELTHEVRKGHADLRDEIRKGDAELRDEIKKGDAELRDEMQKRYAELSEQIHRGQVEIYKSHGDIYKHLEEIAWRVYGVIALAMSAAYFIARYVH
jgi:hypothetical protein